MELAGALTNESTKLTINLEAIGLESQEQYGNNLLNVQKSRGRLLKKVLKTDFDIIADTSWLKEEGIVSFPIFKSSVDAQIILNNLQLTQAISNFADRSKFVSPKDNQAPNEKFILRTWLVRIGMVGDQYKEARKMFLKDLKGNSAWLKKIDAEELEPEEVVQVQETLSEADREWLDQLAETELAEYERHFAESADVQKAEVEQNDAVEPKETEAEKDNLAEPEEATAEREDLDRNPIDEQEVSEDEIGFSGMDF